EWPRQPGTTSRGELLDQVGERGALFLEALDRGEQVGIVWRRLKCGTNLPECIVELLELDTESLHRDRFGELDSGRRLRPLDRRSQHAECNDQSRRDRGGQQQAPDTTRRPVADRR